MDNQGKVELYSAVSKGVILIAGVVIILWFSYQVITALLLLLFAMVLAIIINAPVSRLENRGIKRGLACLIVFSLILIAIGILGWLVIPKISEQFRSLITNLPSYVDSLNRKIAGWLHNMPAVSENVKEEEMDISKWLPSVRQAAMGIGMYSVSLIAGVVIFIIFISMVVYAVVNPKPLLEIYFLLFSRSKRKIAAGAFQHASQMLVGWFRSNLIGGSIEAVLTVVVLSILNVPGAWVWGALALFAELVPKIGFYIMSIPPILVAFSVSPTTAIWVAIFFLALNEVMGDFVMPRLRSSTMSIHPVSTLFMMLAMGSAFGLVGALLATPMAALIKAYYYAFFVNEKEKDQTLEPLIDQALNLPVKKKS